MKHSVLVTLSIVLLFLSAQLVGLWILSQDISVTVTETGEYVVGYQDEWERPDVQGFGAVAYIMGAILAGTVLLLIIIKFRKRMLWKAWFFLAVWLTITLSLGVFLDEWAALTVGLLLAFLKFSWRHILVHNLTEVFLYSGIAVLLVPLLELKWAALLLLLIAVYDFIAVFKSKHMVTMAKFQTTENVFAGLSIPYSKASGTPVMGTLQPVESESEETVKSAVLGGGDIAFPLIFSGSVMQNLAQRGIAVGTAFSYTLILSLFAGAALLGLLLYGKKDKFYPAMPVLGAGCFLGLLAVELLV